MVLQSSQSISSHVLSRKRSRVSRYSLHCVPCPLQCSPESKDSLAAGRLYWKLKDRILLQADYAYGLTNCTGAVPLRTTKSPRKSLMLVPFLHAYSLESRNCIRRLKRAGGGGIKRPWRKQAETDPGPRTVARRSLFNASVNIVPSHPSRTIFGVSGETR